MKEDILANQHRLNLRPANSKDANFVNDLTIMAMESYVRETWQKEEDVKTYFQINQFKLKSTQIVQLNKQDIGRLSVSYQDDHICLENIHILPAFQGQGIGKELIENLILEAKAKNLPLILSVLEVNPAKKLYDSLGFQVYEKKNNRFYMKLLPRS